ncbi:MAG: protein kinase [Byssovorax sp.]
MFPGYRVEAILGRGGFGTVFAARREPGGDRVAIKLARGDRPGAGGRLLGEAAALEAVGPPHVPVVFERGITAGGDPYVVMGYHEAPPLARRLFAGSEPVPVAQACRLAIAILHAVEAIHAKGYVHRDLKPENILVGDEGRAWILDLGLASAPSAPAPELGSSGEGAVAGTAEYMAPEQCDGRADIDARADVYAMGVILHELVSGRPPFSGTPAVIKQAHMGHRPPRLTSLSGEPVPAAVEAIVRRCLAKDREDRFESAAALRLAIERAIERPIDPPVDERDPALVPPGGPALGAASAGPARAASSEGPRALCLLFFEAEADVMAIQAALRALGGHLAHASGRRCVAVLEPEQGDNPVDLASSAARSLIDKGISARVRLDLGPVSIQTRKDGSKRFLSPLFSRGDRFPSGDGPPGLSFAPTFADAAPASIPRAGDMSMGDPALSAIGREPRPHGADPMEAPLFGRDDLLAALALGARRAAREASPSIAIVLGELGQGKTRLAGALAARLEGLDPRVEVIALRARGLPGGAEETVRELLGRLLDLPPTAPPDGGEALLVERLGPHSSAAPAVALAIGWARSSGPEAPAWPDVRAQEAAPGALRSMLTLALGEVLRARAARRPLAVVLDDAHLAGEVLLGALEVATLAEAGAPIWIGVFARPSFAEDHAAWGERAARRDEVRLGALDPASAVELCRWLLRPVEDVSAAAAERLVARAEACPLLLAELIRGLGRAGMIHRSPRGDAWYLATDELDRLPDLPLVVWSAQRELDALPVALRAHARMLALLGDEVTIPEIAGVLRRLDERGGADDLPLDAGVAADRLLDAGLTIRDDRGRISFRHPLVREEFARSAPDALRRRVHLAASDYYGGEAPPGDRRLAQLALHAARAGLSAVAAEAYLGLARKAAAHHAYTEAERLYTRSLEQQAETDPRRLEAHQGRGLMRYRIGRYHDALADFSMARAAAARESDARIQIEILLDEATALDWMDEHERSAARVEEAGALMPEPAPPLLGARLLLGRGRSAHRASREEEAAALIERAAAEASLLGDEGYETLVIALLMLGFILQGLGRLDDAGAALERAIARCEEHGDTFHRGAAYLNRGLLRAVLGQTEGMVDDLRRSIAMARSLGQSSLELMGEYDLGEYLYLMDDLDAAEPHVKRARAIDRRLAGGEGRAVVVLLEARLACYRGDEASARALIAGIRERQARASGDARAAAQLAPSDDVLCAMVELSLDDGSDAAWDALEARSAVSSVGQERIEVIEGRAIAAIRRGREEAGRRALERAIALSAVIPNVMAQRLRSRLPPESVLPPGF